MKRWLAAILTGLVALWLPLAHAEDTDLFNTSINTDTERPNVLIIMDNSANWSSNDRFAWEKSTLATVVGNLDDRFNVGLMMFTETGSGNSGNDGGYVRYAARQMSTANKAALGSLITNLDETTDKSNGGKASLVMDEAYRYFAGQAAYAGASKAKTDLGAFDGGTFRQGAGSGNYSAPITNSCQKNFIIYISNGKADNASDVSTSTSHLSAFGGNTAMIALSPSGEQETVADEWARFMSGSDVSAAQAGTQSIVTYTIDVLPPSTGSGPGWTAMLKSMAAKGKGAYFTSTDASSLSTVLTKIFNEIQSVNSVFAAVTLPVSVSVRGEYLNQIYMGVFRPDAFKSPRWPGNLKLYELGCVSTGAGTACDAVQLQDADGEAVEDATYGFVKPCVKSFWTGDSTFWSFAPQTNCSTATPSSDSPDGDLVEKGGAAQKLRTAYASSQATRPVYTCQSCTSGTALSTQAFNSSNATLVSAVDTAYGSVSNVPVSLARTVGSTVVNATATSSIALNTGDSITVSGASDALYNGTYTVTSAPTGTTFTFGVTPTQTPALSACASGCTASKATATTFAGTAITRTTDPASSLSATVTAAGNTLANGDTFSISGLTGSNASFNGTYTAAVSGGTLSVSMPDPGYTTPATLSSATATVGSSTVSLASITRTGYTVTVTMTGSGSTALPAAFIANATVTIAGASPTAYNGSYTIFEVKPNSNSTTCPNGDNKRAFCYRLIPATVSSAFTLTKANPPVAITAISRAAYSGTNPVTTTVSTGAVAHGYATNDSVTISGATGTDTAYNGAQTITRIDDYSFSYGVTVTESPSTSATATVSKGASAAIVATDLINWIRGADNYDDENSTGSASPLSASTDVRASIHGDVVHSRPVVMDYYTSGAEDVVIYYGSNDGVLHAIKGGTGGTGGTELWAFVAPEHLGKFDRLRTQTPQISTSVTKPYFFDGPIGSYVVRNADKTVNKAYIFPTMRRGGRYIYAFDVTDYNNPKFLWKKGCPNASGTTGCDTGFGELGQSWSAPVSAKVNIGGTATAVVILGAGYDNAAEDVEPRGTAAMGRGIFVLNVETGAIIRAFGTSDGFDASIASDVFVGEITGDSYDDIIYAADTAGGIWRMDINNTVASNWTVYKLGALGTNQKFLFGPTAAYGKDSTGSYFAVLIGAGDREHPGDTTVNPTTCAIESYYFMLKDRNTGVISSTAGLATIVPADLAAATNNDGTDATVDANTTYGWKLRLPNTPCEKTVSGAAIVSGTVFFNTHSPTNPAAGSCSGLGTARSYAVDISTAAAPTSTLGTTTRSTTLPGGGLPPTPVVAYTRPNANDDDDGDDDNNSDVPPKVIVCIGQHCFEVTGASAGNRYRSYWYELKSD